MFAGVARLTLQIPENGSLKGKRQIVRKIVDRVRARFNCAIAEVEDNDLWQKATVAISVVGNDKRHVNEQVEKIIHFVEDMYVAPLISREMELLGFGDQLFQPGTRSEGYDMTLELPFVRGDRSMAEAEGLGSWNERHTDIVGVSKGAGKKHPGAASKAEPGVEEAKERARALRNRRDWEKE